MASHTVHLVVLGEVKYCSNHLLIGGVLGHLILTVLDLADRIKTMDLKLVKQPLSPSVLKSSEPCCPLADRTFSPEFRDTLLLPPGLAGSLLLSSHCAMELVLAQQVWSSSRLLASLAGTSLLSGHKEKDHIDPPALSRIRHFISRK